MCSPCRVSELLHVISRPWMFWSRRVSRTCLFNAHYEQILLLCLLNITVNKLCSFFTCILSCFFMSTCSFKQRNMDVVLLLWKGRDRKFTLSRFKSRALRNCWAFILPAAVELFLNCANSCKVTKDQTCAPGFVFLGILCTFPGCLHAVWS